MKRVQAKAIGNFLGIGVAALLFVAVIWACFYLGKLISYELFYKEQVIKTIEQSVKSSCLK